MQLFKTKNDANAQKKEQRLKIERERLSALKTACKECFKDAQGVYLLEFLKKICLWDSENTNIDKDVLAYRNGRRDIWLILRTLLPKDILARVEIYSEE